ncbi:CvfD/Ygs/GSP13 family RNA-binding post-transcriptional regulator [Ligilactobacillus ceti]|nr:CvfD/Ygs/GSP13 family RNA-binding post-transcriptional regulator [Ligilactobacillus ceti]
MDYKIGMIIEGKVTGIQPYGAFVALDDNTQGLIHISECHHGFVANIGEMLNVGDAVEVMIIDIDEYSKKISLSLRCLERPFDFSPAKKSYKNYHKKYWTNRRLQIGFKTIDDQLPLWISEALDKIE